MWCPKCRRDKPVNEFPLNRSSKTGRQSYCKPCHNEIVRENRRKLHGSTKNFMLKHRYGIDEAEWDRLMEAQNGICAICKVQPAEHVDHCHDSAKVRGLLCFNCNGGLGRFQDDEAVMERAIEYLVAHGHG